MKHNKLTGRYSLEPNNQASVVQIFWFLDHKKTCLRNACSVNVHLETMYGMLNKKQKY